AGGLVLAAAAAPAAPARHKPATGGFVMASAIPAPDGGWDYASWDSAHRLLLVAHGKDVLVIDPATRAVRAVGALEGAHGAVAIPD
ncbi:hypothetical protein ABTM24_20295, partial [Acinetobacter baumannii]